MMPMKARLERSLRLHAEGSERSPRGLKGSRNLCCVLRDAKCKNMLLNEEPFEIS